MPKLKLSTLAMAAAMAVAAGNVAAQELRVLTFGGEAELKSTQDSAARFMAAHPGVNVTVDLDAGTSGGWGDYIVRILTQFNTGTNYDVYHTAIETFQSLASKEVFEPLEARINGDESFKDFDSRLFKLSEYAGHNYFVPSTWNNVVIHYNKDLFKAAGVELPVDGWTWDEFRAAAEKLTIRDASGNVTQFGYEVPNGFFMTMPWFIANGTSVLNADWTGSNMLDPKMAESLQFMHDLVHVSKVSPIPGDGMDHQFYAGQVAMVSRGHWSTQNDRTSGLDIDVAPVPSMVNDHTVIGFGAYAMANNTPDKDLAWELIKSLTDLETQKAEGDMGGAVPGRKSAAESESFLAYPDNAELYYKTLSTAEAVPSPPNFVEIASIFNRYYGLIMADQMPVAEAVKAAHEEMEASFAALKAGQ